MTTQESERRERVARAIHEGLRGTSRHRVARLPWDDAWGQDRVDSFAIADAVLDAIGPGAQKRPGEPEDTRDHASTGEDGAEGSSIEMARVQTLLPIARYAIQSAANEASLYDSELTAKLDRITQELEGL
jgi:hypothetical protein